MAAASPGADAPPGVGGSEALDRVRATVLRFAFRGETGLCVVRIVFCVAVALRFLAVAYAERDANVVLRFVTELPPLMLAVGASVYVLRQLRRGRGRLSLLRASVSLDAVLCFFGLLPNVLFASPDYPGLLAMPDSGALLLMVAASGLRQSPALCWLALGLNAVSTAVLLLSDALLSHALAYDTSDVILFAMFLLGMGVLAATAARMAQSIAERSAVESGLLERTKGELTLLLEEHHGARTLLSSCTLRAQLLEQALKNTDDYTGQAQAAALASDLAMLATHARELRERSVADLVALSGSRWVDLGRTLEAALPKLRAQNPALLVELLRPLDVGSASPEAIQVSVVGGAVGIARMLQNAVNNSVQGNGAAGATKVDLSWTLAARDDGPLALLCIEDDGPGFPASLLAAPELALAAKPGGSGIGLMLIQQLAVESGGTVRISNRGGDGGARVEIALPAARRQAIRRRSARS